MPSLGSIVRAYATLLFILPLLIVPFIGVDAELQKSMLLTLCLGLALLGAAGAFARGAPLPRPALAVPAFFLAAAILATFNAHTIYAVFGSGSEVTTLASVVLFFGSTAIASLLDRRSIGSILDVFVIAAALCGALTAIIGTSLPVVALAPALSASWPMIPFFCAAALSVAALDIDLHGVRVVHIVCVPVLALVGALFFTTSAAVLLFIFALCASLLLFRMGRAPYAHAIFSLAVLSALLLGMRAPLIEVRVVSRPTWNATELVLASAVRSPGEAVFGSGPNSVRAAWYENRPQLLNDSLLWAQPTDTTYSALTNFAVTFGIVGAVVWLLVPFELYRRFRESILDDSPQYGTMRALALSAFLWAACAIYPMSTTPFVLCGVCAYLGAREGSMFRVSSRVRTLIVTVLAVCGLGLLCIGTLQSRAAILEARGLRIAGSDLPSAAGHLEAAARSWPIARYHVEASRADLLLGEPELHSNGKDAVEILRQAAAQAAAAQSLEPGNYDALLWRATLGIRLAQHGDPYAVVRGLSDGLGTLAPTMPQGEFMSAVSSVLEGDYSGAFDPLVIALTMKPEYGDARELEAQFFDGR